MGEEDEISKKKEEKSMNGTWGKNNFLTNTYNFQWC